MRACFSILLLASGLLLQSGPPALAQADFSEAARSWRAWATQALESPPGGIRPYPELARRLMSLINERRTGAGQDLTALQEDEDLGRAAQAHAFDLLRRDFMAHESPEGLQPGDRVGLLARRHVGGAGENVAEHEGLARDALDGQLGPLSVKLADGFMASAGHRENILQPEYTHHALAAASEGERLVVVHVFGARRTRLSDELPFQVRAGDRLPLAFDDARPARFAFKAPGQPVEDVVVLELSSDSVSVDPGLWRLVFMFEGGSPGVYDVADGPFIDVR